MTVIKKSLAKLSRKPEKLSEKWAVELIDNIESGNDDVSFVPKNILDQYEDSGYTPSFSDIKKWLVKERSREDPATNYPQIFGGADPDEFAVKLVGTISEYLEGGIDKKHAVSRLAEQYSWVEMSAFWNENPMLEHWHYARLESASYQVGKLHSKTIDDLYDLLNSIVHAKTALGIDAILGKKTPLELSTIESELNSSFATVKKIIGSIEEIGEFYLKIGFLYRDHWWKRNHEQAAVEGYLARINNAVRGKSGSKASSAARMKRIKLLLDEHARLIAENPDLKDDNESDVAVRAIKKAKKKYPNAFKTGASNNKAREYWSYILSDEALCKEYADKLRKYSGL